MTPGRPHPQPGRRILLVLADATGFGPQTTTLAPVLLHRPTQLQLWLHLLVNTPTIVATVDAALATVIVVLLLKVAEAPRIALVAGGVLAFLAVWGTLFFLSGASPAVMRAVPGLAEEQGEHGEDEQLQHLVDGDHAHSTVANPGPPARRMSASAGQRRSMVVGRRGRRRGRLAAPGSSLCWQPWAGVPTVGRCLEEPQHQ